MSDFHILAINPGSTSTKIAIYSNSNHILLKNIHHSSEELDEFQNISDQFEYRKKIIEDELAIEEIDRRIIHAVVGRGGLVKPIASGVYEVNEAMRQDLLHSPFGEHASNLGGLLAYAIASSIKGCRSFIVDPVVVDELEVFARYTGHSRFTKRSIFHALNQKAVARAHAKAIMREYESLNLIVIHLGGGITVGAHKMGKVVDVNQGLDGDGPFSPERSGSLPVGDLVRACFSGEVSEPEMMKRINGEGGLVSYFGTNSAYDVEKLILNGNDHAKEVFQAMAYQVSKEIGAMGAVLKGQVDAILITGGIAHSKFFVNEIIERVFKIAPVYVYPGEDEMKALAANGLGVMRGELTIKKYE